VASAAQDEATLPAGYCAPCGREVLTHVDFARDGTTLRRCVHCDQPVPATQAIATADLDALGYAIVEPRGGCGSGGACGSGGCAPRRTS